MVHKSRPKDCNRPTTRKSKRKKKTKIWDDFVYTTSQSSKSDNKMEISHSQCNPSNRSNSLSDTSLDTVVLNSSNLATDLTGPLHQSTPNKVQEISIQLEDYRSVVVEVDKNISWYQEKSETCLQNNVTQTSPENEYKTQNKLLQQKVIQLEQKLTNQEQQTIYFSQKANDMEKLFENQKFETQSVVNKLQIVTNEMQFQVEHSIQLTAEIARLNEQVIILKKSLPSWSSVVKHQVEKKHTQHELKLPSGTRSTPETTEQSTIIDRLASGNKTSQEQNYTNQSSNESLRSEGIPVTEQQQIKPRKKETKPETYIIGDSIIRGVRANNSQNYVYGGATISRLTERVEKIIQMKDSPNNIILHAGINDILNDHSKSQIEMDYLALCNKVKGYTGMSIYLSGIIHHGPNKSVDYGCLNKRIDIVFKHGIHLY